MKVYFLNVGYGEAIVVRSGATTIVVDGGPGRNEVYAQPNTIRLASFLKLLGISRVDLVLITHIHEDHIGGLPEVIAQFEIGEIWCNICPEGNIPVMLSRLRERALADNSSTLFYLAFEAFERIQVIARERDIPLHAVAGGTVAAYGSLGITALGMTTSQLMHTQQRFHEMLEASDERLLFKLFCENDFICNASSLACHVCEGNAAVLLSGDKVGGWKTLREQYDLRAQVLKITHHGQKDGMPLDMLEGADPEAIIVCADRNRTYQSADPAVLTRAENYLVTHGRPSKIFITGSLYREGIAGNALELTLDPETSCTNASVKSYG